MSAPASPHYDGRQSALCALDCVWGGCVPSWADPYGCGSCCHCLGGCHAGYEEQLHELQVAEQSARVETTQPLARYL